MPDALKDRGVEAGGFTNALRERISADHDRAGHYYSHVGANHRRIPVEMRRVVRQKEQRSTATVRLVGHRNIVGCKTGVLPAGRETVNGELQEI